MSAPFASVLASSHRAVESCALRLRQPNTHTHAHSHVLCEYTQSSYVGLPAWCIEAVRAPARVSEQKFRLRRTCARARALLYPSSVACDFQQFHNWLSKSVGCARDKPPLTQQQTAHRLCGCLMCRRGPDAADDSAGNPYAKPDQGMPRARSIIRWAPSWLVLRSGVEWPEMNVH